MKNLLVRAGTGTGFRAPTLGELWLPQTEAEGPGVRMAVWVQGCPMRCLGCCNPEMLPFERAEGGSPRTVASLLEALAGSPAEGLSLPLHCVPREGVFQRHAQLARLLDDDEHFVPEAPVDMYRVWAWTAGGRST